MKTPRLRPLPALLIAASLAPATAGATDWMYYYRLRSATVDGVKPGGNIVLKTNDGGRVRGRLVERADDLITLRDREGAQRTYQWAELRWARCKNKGLGDLLPSIVTKAFRSSKPELKGIPAE